MEEKIQPLHIFCQLEAVALKNLTMFSIAPNMVCHILPDLSGLVFFSTEDFSTSCIQFDLSPFQKLRLNDGKIDLDRFYLICRTDEALGELKRQLLEHNFLTERL
jgi:hypothetical protein